jgi:hypothetical protein
VNFGRTNQVIFSRGVIEILIAIPAKAFYFEEKYSYG